MSLNLDIDALDADPLRHIDGHKVVIQICHFTQQAAVGGDLVTYLHCRHHALVFFFLFLLGADQKEIEQSKN